MTELFCCHPAGCVDFKPSRPHRCDGYYRRTSEIRANTRNRKTTPALNYPHARQCRGLGKRRAIKGTSARTLRFEREFARAWPYSPPAKREGSGREGMLPAAFSWPARSRGAGRLPAHHKAGPATRGSVGPVFPQVASNHSGRRKSRRTGEVPAQQCPGIGRPGALEPFIGGMVQNAGARITAVSTSHYSRESFGLGSLRWAEPSSAELKGARADFNRGVVTVLTSSPTASLVHAVLASRA